MGVYGALAALCRGTNTIGMGTIDRRCCDSQIRLMLCLAITFRFENLIQKLRHAPKYS